MKDGSERCVNISESCDAIVEVDICLTPGTAVEPSTSTPYDCFWVYDNDLDLNSGTCENKDDNNLKCEDILTKNQCENGLTETFLNDKCTYYDDICLLKCELIERVECDIRIDCSWIYNNNADDNYDGSCYSKNETNIFCNNIQREGQCNDGGEIDKLKDKCEIYDGTCKVRCDKLLLDDSDDGCEFDDRKNDCYLLSGRDDIPGRCVNFVCYIIYINYILIYMFWVRYFIDYIYLL
jgi:hypothetical protein